MALLAGTFGVLNMRTEIGKIARCLVGMGGYQDAQFGVTFNLTGKAWGCGDFWGMWSNEPDAHTKWTKQDQLTSIGTTFLRLHKLMVDAGVHDAADLVGKPIEASFEGMGLKSWRILTEVL